MTPKGIMLHSTGANNPNLCRYIAPDDGRLGTNRYDNHWNQGNIKKCVHAMIGKLADGTVAIYQTLPWDMRGWHCAKSSNSTHISIEICEDALTDKDYFERVYTMAVELCAYLCREFGFDPLEHGVILDHEEGYRLGIASDHNDVGYWFKAFGLSMDSFRGDVARTLAEPKTTVPEVDPLAAHEREHHKVYETLEAVPAWAREEIRDLVEKELLLGDGKGLNLSHDLLRTLIVLHRALTAAGVL